MKLKHKMLLPPDSHSHVKHDYRNVNDSIANDVKQNIFEICFDVRNEKKRCSKA